MISINMLEILLTNKMIVIPTFLPCKILSHCMNWYAVLRLSDWPLIHLPFFFLLLWQHAHTRALLVQRYFHPEDSLISESYLRRLNGVAGHKQLSLRKVCGGCVHVFSIKKTFAGVWVWSREYTSRVYSVLMCERKQGCRYRKRSCENERERKDRNIADLMFLENEMTLLRRVGQGWCRSLWLTRNAFIS